MTDVEQKLRDQAAAMPDAELRESLDWFQALADHADENFRGADYANAMLKVAIIGAELANRRGNGNGLSCSE